MKILEVEIKGEHEEEMCREMLSCIYGVIQSYEYTDVLVRTDTVDGRDETEIQIPEFPKLYKRSMRGGRGHLTGNTSF